VEPLVWRLHHQHDDHMLLRVDPEISAGDGAPEKFADRAGTGDIPCARRTAKPSSKPYPISGTGASCPKRERAVSPKPIGETGNSHTSIKYMKATKATMTIAQVSNVESSMKFSQSTNTSTGRVRYNQSIDASVVLPTHKLHVMRENRRPARSATQGSTGRPRQTKGLQFANWRGKDTGRSTAALRGTGQSAG
jgi:hypothetical protein